MQQWLTVTRKDPDPDAEAARWCQRSHSVEAYVINSNSRHWFADSLWSAIKTGDNIESPKWCKKLLNVIRTEIGRNGYEQLLEEFDDYINSRDYITKHICQHGSLIPHLIQTYFREIGETHCFTCSFDTDRIMLTTRLWSPLDVVNRLCESLPIFIDYYDQTSIKSFEVSVIRMPDHRDALAQTMPIISSVNYNKTETAEYALNNALLMHRPFLDFFFNQVYE